MYSFSSSCFLFLSFMCLVFLVPSLYLPTFPHFLFSRPATIIRNNLLLRPLTRSADLATLLPLFFFLDHSLFLSLFPLLSCFDRHSEAPATAFLLPCLLLLYSSALCTLCPSAVSSLAASSNSPPLCHRHPSRGCYPESSCEISGPTRAPSLFWPVFHSLFSYFIPSS